MCRIANVEQSNTRATQTAATLLHEHRPGLHTLIGMLRASVSADRSERTRIMLHTFPRSAPLVGARGRHVLHARRPHSHPPGGGDYRRAASGDSGPQSAPGLSASEQTVTLPGWERHRAAHVIPLPRVSVRQTGCCTAPHRTRRRPVVRRESHARPVDGLLRQKSCRRA